MPSTPNFPNPAAADIAQKWLHLGQDWARWWAEFGGAASTQPTRGGVPSTRVDIAAKAGLANSDALGALNEKYRRRWEALWTAAAASLAPNGTAVRLPAVVEADPGDRRFAAREWSELPYFALMNRVISSPANTCRSLRGCLADAKRTSGASHSPPGNSSTRSHRRISWRQTPRC